ncbi:MAG: uracil-DNA glycosylase [Gammaproteobacteria bacterium]
MKNVSIDKSWKSLLKDEFVQPYFQDLITFVRSEYSVNQCFPPEELIYSAFDHCRADQVKVVIIGQDPYHGNGQANGLCFSVNDGVSVPRSLQNIYKEIFSDLGKAISKSGNLEHWADQGVLLLNATLTVRAHEAGSHQKKGWEKFTDAVIAKINDSNSGVVFILWGAFAQKKGAMIDTHKHHVLKAVHPSPLSASRGFFGCKHFSQTNDYLRSMGKEKIEW